MDSKVLLPTAVRLPAVAVVAVGLAALVGVVGSLALAAYVLNRRGAEPRGADDSVMQNPD
jgi:hypothetical protein